MDDITMKQIADAYNRIEQSLSGRFEKDVRLYLPMEDIEELKKLIYQGKYEKILEKYRLKKNKYTAEVLANVLIKNAWLMQGNAKRKELFPIFEQCDIEYLSNIMRDGILDNKIEMPLEFRSDLISLYLQRLDSLTCENMLEQNPSFLNNSQLRAACVCSAVKELSVEERYLKFNKYAKQWPNILMAQSVFKSLFSKKEVNDMDICECILKDQIVSFDNRLERNFWFDMLDIHGIRNVLILLKSYFCEHSSDIKKGKIIAGRILILLQRDLNNLSEAFADACTSLDRAAREAVAQEVYKRLPDEKSRRTISAALAEYGVEFEEKQNEFADIDTISEKLNDVYLSPKLLGFLIISFDKQYRKTYSQSLQRLKDECWDDDSYNMFVCELAIRRFPSFVPYMLYVMDEIAPYDERVMDDVLKTFENKDILRTGKKSKLSKEEYLQISNFIKQNNFELFKMLTI